MTVDLDDDCKLLRKLIEQGGRKYTAGSIDRRKYERLVELGWLVATSANVSDNLYEVTGQGAARRWLMAIQCHDVRAPVVARPEFRPIGGTQHSSGGLLLFRFSGFSG